MVDIVEVKSRKQLKEFIYFPFKLYEDNPYWVPPLIMDEYITLDRRKTPRLSTATRNTGWPTRTASLWGG